MIKNDCEHVHIPVINKLLVSLINKLLVSVINKLLVSVIFIRFLVRNSCIFLFTLVFWKQILIILKEFFNSPNFLVLIYFRMLEKDLYATILIKELLGPSLLIFGLVSNIMAIKILKTKIMKNYTSTNYMKIISFVDIMLVIIFSSQTIFEVYLSIDIRLLHILGCKIVTFSLYYKLVSY